MASVRSIAVTTALCMGLLSSGCSHRGVGASYTPATMDAARASANVVVHKTYMVQDAQSQPHTSGSIAYLGNVTTLPAIVNLPTDITYNADDGNFYTVNQGQNAYTTSILRVEKTGGTSSFSSIPSYAEGIAYDHATRKLYVTTVGNAPGVYVIDSSGGATPIAGGTTSGHTDGTGSAASFTFPTGITVDGKDGALYIVDGDRVRRMTVGGVVTTLTAPNSIGWQYSISGAGFSGIAWSPYDGYLYVADAQANMIRKVTLAGAVSTVAGQCAAPPFAGSCASLQRDGQGANALFAQPGGITVTPSNGYLYVADNANNAIRRVLPSGSVTTLAGNGLQQDVDGAGQNAEFNSPASLAFGAGELYVVESNSGPRTSAMRTVTITGAAPPPLPTKITLYDTKTPAAQPFAIDWRSTTPSSATLWYSEGGGRIASLTTSGVSTDYAVAGNNVALQDLVLGSDGTPWVYDPADGQLTHRTASGALKPYKLTYLVCCGAPFMPDQVAAAPNGNIWVMQNSGNGSLEYVTPQGTLTALNPPQYFYSNTVAIAGDGTVWLANGNSIVRLDSTGKVMATYNYPAQSLARSGDGNILFTQSDAIGKIVVASGLIEVFPLYQPVAGCSGCSHGVVAVTQGPDGAYWFTEQTAGAIGRLDPNGGFTEYIIYSAHRHPFDIVSAPDGNMWFTDTGSQKIGKLKIH